MPDDPWLVTKLANRLRSMDADDLEKFLNTLKALRAHVQMSEFNAEGELITTMRPLDPEQLVRM
jgi:hypothetical protein